MIRHLRALEEEHERMHFMSSSMLQSQPVTALSEAQLASSIVKTDAGDLAPMDVEMTAVETSEVNLTRVLVKGL